jgi:hypothetical protein
MAYELGYLLQLWRPRTQGDDRDRYEPGPSKVIAHNSSNLRKGLTGDLVILGFHLDP